MLFAGDEFANTQFGNNNPYCQDNVINWLVWEAISLKDRKLVRYVRRLIALRKHLNIFKRNQFFSGKSIGRSYFKDLAWYTEHGNEFTSAAWNTAERKALAYAVYGKGKLLFVIFNANDKSLEWKLPLLKKTKKWKVLSESSGKLKNKENVDAGEVINVPAWSVTAIEVSI